MIEAPTHVYVFSTESEDETGISSMTEVKEIFLDRVKAEEFKLQYDSIKFFRGDGSFYTRKSNPIDKWPLADNVVPE